MNKKYELTEKSIYVPSRNVTLYQIKALQDFGNVEAGDLGGFIQSERNLSQYGMCWVDDYAQIFDYASITGNAVITGHAKVFDHAQISGDVFVTDFAKVCDWSIITEDCRLYNFAKIIGRSILAGSIVVKENAIVSTEGTILTNNGDGDEYSQYNIIIKDIIIGGKYNSVNTLEPENGPAGIYNDAEVYRDAIISADAECINEMIKTLEDIKAGLGKIIEMKNNS